MIPNWVALILSVAEKVDDTTKQVVQEAAQSAVNDTILAIVFLVVAVGLLLLEILVVSYGLLAISALGFAIAGIALGFSSSPAVGWTLLAITPILTVLIVMWGFRRLQRSHLVPKDEITEDAGYRHATENMGIVIGSSGTLVTDAIPTGRARFAKGEIDVQMEGPAAMKGAKIIVKRIEGPTVIAVADLGTHA